MPLHRAAILASPWLLSAALLSACSGLKTPSAESAASTDQRVTALLPADALLLGEQHDAPKHQVLERETVEALVRRGHLAALALEMADEGSTTQYLSSSATEAQVRTALGWSDTAWPWAQYGPAIMAAVRAGVPVVGANLPRDRMTAAMADVSLDVQLPDTAWQAQQQAVREGHCNLLPSAQILPMTRIQVARDRAMALAIAKARQPGKTVLLVSGAAHSDRALGVPQHLPTDVRVKTIGMLAGDGPARPGDDAVWRTPAVPEKDYCAALRK